MQDALTTLVRRVGALRAAEAVTSWLFVTIRRACLRRVPGIVLVPTGVAGDLAGAGLASDVADRGGRRGSGGPAAAQSEVIMLVDLLDLPVERTARQLGIGVRAAKSRLHRARRALAVLLGQPELRTSA